VEGGEECSSVVERVGRRRRARWGKLEYAVGILEPMVWESTGGRREGVHDPIPRYVSNAAPVCQLFRKGPGQGKGKALHGFTEELFAGPTGEVRGELLG
jgi:hypothetical protein